MCKENIVQLVYEKVFAGDQRVLFSPGGSMLGIHKEFKLLSPNRRP